MSALQKAAMKHSWKIFHLCWVREKSWHARFQPPAQHETKRHVWNPELRVKVTMTGWGDCLAMLSTIPPKPGLPVRESLCYWGSFIHTPNHTEQLCVASPVCACLCACNVSVYTPAGCAAGWVGHAEPDVCVKRPNSPSAQCFLDTYSPNAPPAPVPSGWDAAPEKHTQTHILDMPKKFKLLWLTPATALTHTPIIY